MEVLDTNYKQEIDKLVEEIKAQGYENICFWLPAYNVGGGTFILCKIAQYLSKNTNLNIFYMDYKDGYPTSILKDNNNITIFNYNENNPNFPLKEKCIIVTNSTRAIQFPEMNSDNKLLFWHYETNYSAFEIVLIDNEWKKFLKLTDKETNSIS